MKNNPTVDTWKSPPWMNQYEVSTTGQVRRKEPGPGASAGKVFRPGTTTSGPTVKLQGMPSFLLPRASKAGLKYRNISVARLMLYTFVGMPPSPFSTAKFHDGNKTHLDLANLFWGDDERMENVLHNPRRNWKRDHKAPGGFRVVNEDDPEQQTP